MNKYVYTRTDAPRISGKQERNNFESSSIHRRQTSYFCSCLTWFYIISSFTCHMLCHNETWCGDQNGSSGGDSSGPKSLVVCDPIPHVAGRSRRVNHITTLKLLCCVNRATI